MTTTLGAATLFAVAPDGEASAKMLTTRSFATAVMPSEDGGEVRAAMRDLPVRTIQFSPAFGGSLELMRFRSLWFGATERLRFIVPLWTELSTPIAIPDASTISVDTVNHGYASGQRFILWQSETLNELVTLEDVADDGVTLVDPLVGTYAPAACSLVPVMNAWLELPTLDQRSHSVEVVELTFREEVEGVAGIDPDVGASATPTPATLDLVGGRSGSPWVGLKFATVEAIAKDDDGQRIPRPPIVWSIANTSGHTALSDPTTRSCPTGDGQQYNLEWSDGTTTLFTITATLGGLTATQSFQ